METTFSNYPYKKCNICGYDTKVGLDNFVGYQNDGQGGLLALFQCDTTHCENTLTAREVINEIL